MSTNTPEHVTPGDIARELDVPHYTVEYRLKQLLRSGRIEVAFRLGGIRCFDRSVVKVIQDAVDRSTPVNDLAPAESEHANVQPITAPPNS